MSDIAESIEKLTASLQQLTAESREETQVQTPPVPRSLPARQLKLSRGVETFVRRNSEYEAATRLVSEGTY